MKETPSSPGGQGGREGDSPLLKGNQTKFRKKNGHSGQREGGKEDQSRALSDHVAQGLQWCPMHRNGDLIKDCSFLESARCVYKYSLYHPVKFYVWELHDEGTSYCTEDSGVNAAEDKQGMWREEHGVHFTTVQDRDSPSGVRTKAQRRLKLVWG